MNDIESRLADAMAARAREVEPHDEDDALNRISERVNMNRRRGLTVLGIAAALAIVVGAVALLQRDDKVKRRDRSGRLYVDNGRQPHRQRDPRRPGPTPIWPFAEEVTRGSCSPQMRRRASPSTTSA